MMKTTAVSAVFMAILMIALVGMPSVAKAQTPAGDTLIVGVQNDTPNLHPWDVATNSVWKAFLWRQWVYEGLYGLSPDGNIFPVLAESFTTPPGDPLNVTVTLRQGVTFTDGTPMTADDVIFSFQILGFNSQLSDTVLASIVWQDGVSFPRWNASTSAWGAANPTHVGVTKINANTVKFQLRQAYSMFYFGTLTNPIMPSHIWKDHLRTVDVTNYVLPDGTALSTGTEFDFDASFGSSETDVQATIGTGPWYLVQWTPLTSATLRVYDNYWGKSQSVTWQGRDWPLFPSTIKRMEFKIYGTLDVAILAMKSGEVHVVPWHLPTGFFNDLQRDPRMGFQISASDGFFYLAFNMRREPFNDLEFRKAVSYAIDKDFIVDRLLGGYGIKGQVPLSPINPAYINSSAVTPSFDLAQAEAILDAAGYTKGADGWRTFPDGRPLKYSILTPAKDYDPIRADAGIMISNNLKAIGLNIDSAPTAFDAIVSAVFVAVQFDMYILGWVNLGPFPELYMNEFFGCQNDVVLGIGSNSPGYCNAQFEQKMNVLDTEMNDAVRIQAAKDAQGILTRDLPYNTLYITRWIEGYRADIWGGWTSVNGEIFNFYSIGVLGAPGAPQAPTGPLTISLNMPGQGIAGTQSQFQVYAVQAGLPAEGVDVNITASTGEWKTATTGANGAVLVDFTLPYVAGEVTFIASAAKGSDTGGDLATMNIVLPNDYAMLTLESTTPVVAPDGTATIVGKVVDREGDPVAGVPISIIPELVLGTVTPDNGTTDTLGQVSFTYTAPPSNLIPNSNRYDFIKARVDAPTLPRVPEVNERTMTVGVENPVYDWYVLEVQTVSSHVVDTDPVSSVPLTSTVTVLLTKQDGTPVSGEDVTATISDSVAMDVDGGATSTKPTDASGLASFTFTALGAGSSPVSVNFTVSKAFYAMSGLSLLVTDGVTADYATSMSLVTKFANPNSVVDLTVTVYDNTGAPSMGTEVDIFIPYSEVGNPVEVTLPEWTFIGYVGSVFSDLTDASGQITTSFNMKSFVADSRVTLETGIGGFGPQGAFLLGSPTSMYFYEHVIQKRNKLGAVGSWSMTPMPLTPASSSATMTLKLYDNSGPAVGANVSVYRGLGNLLPGRGATKIGYYITGATGQITVNWDEPEQASDTGLGFTAVMTSSNYALGGSVGSAPFEMKFPYLLVGTDPTELFPVGSPSSTIVRTGNAQTYDITVRDFNGNPVQDAVVKTDTATVKSVNTDGTGRAQLILVPGSTNPTGSDAWETVFTITKGSESTTIQLGTLVGIGVFVPSNLQLPASASVGVASTITVDVTNNGPVADSQAVTLNVDGSVFAAKVVTIDPGQTVTVSFTWVPYDNAAHQFSVGSLSGSLAASGAAGGGIDAVLAIGLAIVLLIVGIILGFFIGKRGKAAPEAAPPMEEIEPSMPEEPATEEQPEQ